MLMPQATRPPLTPQCEAIRQAVAALPDHERSHLLHQLTNDQIRRHDALNLERAERFDRERKGRRPDPRQLRLEGAA